MTDRTSTPEFRAARQQWYAARAERAAATGDGPTHRYWMTLWRNGERSKA